jgi:hypothetical protein
VVVGAALDHVTDGDVVEIGGMLYGVGGGADRGNFVHEVIKLWSEWVSLYHADFS